MHKGSCHCGNVKFEFDKEISNYVYCNCSICTMKASKYFFMQEDEFKLISSPENISIYSFATHKAQHYFCSTCGINTHGLSSKMPGHIVVNLNCVENINISTLECHHYNGADD